MPRQPFVEPPAAAIRCIRASLDSGLRDRCEDRIVERWLTHCVACLLWAGLGRGALNEDAGWFPAVDWVKEGADKSGAHRA
jgi:hypothetical protein